MTKAFRKTPAVPKRATGLPLPAAALGAHALLFGLGIWVGIVPAGLLRPCRGCCGMQLEVLMVGAPPAAALRGAWQRPAQPAASPWLFASEFPGAGGKLGTVFFSLAEGCKARAGRLMFALRAAALHRKEPPGLSRGASLADPTPHWGRALCWDPLAGRAP